MDQQQKSDVLKYLLYGLGMAYALTGIGLLLPEGRIHDNLNKEFERYTEVFPLKSVGIPAYPLFYQFLIGTMQLIGGVLLMSGSKLVQQISATVLLPETIGAVWTLFQIGDSIFHIALCIGCAIGLVVLLVNKDSKIKIE